MTNARALLCSPLLLALACGDDGGTTDSATSTVTLPSTIGDTGSSSSPDAPTGGSSSGGGGTDSVSGTTAGDPTTGPAVGTTTVAPSTSEPADTTSPSTTTTVGDTSSGEEAGSTGAPLDECKVNDDMDANVPCTDEAPPNSFEPDIQWVWMGQDGENQIAVTPAIANMTDDNGDGEIDLCDIPDIVVPAYQASYWTGSLYVFDGATGAVHYKVADVGALTYPAIADIDNDGYVV